MAKIALLFNLVHHERFADNKIPLDIMAEYDEPETVDAVVRAIESGGHTVIKIEADETAYNELKRHKSEIDFVFNIAEGIGGESRESEIPIFCEMLGIPYTGSGPLTLAICLDKVRTKEILLYHDIPTPHYQVFTEPGMPVDDTLMYPLIAKLTAEGSSMGLSYDSIVENEKELRRQIDFLFATYNKPVLVEEFIDGKEFGIPLIGNDPAITLPIIEFIFHGRKAISLYVPDKPTDLYQQRNEPTPADEVTKECPAQVSAHLKEKLETLALKAYKVLGCRDWCRLEIRVDKNESPYVIELNPIAGIDPAYRFAHSANVAGITYNDLINRILNYAMKRYGK